MDISLRPTMPADANALAHLLVTANEAAFRGRVPDQCLAFSEAESAPNWRAFFAAGIPADDILVVAETAAKQVVGHAWGGPNTKDGVYSSELRQLLVLPDYQKRGIGRRLVCHVAQRLAERGMHSLRVDVLRVNPNRPFYEHLGATLAGEHPYDWDGVILPECTYGWADTQALLAGPGRQSQ